MGRPRTTKYCWYHKRNHHLTEFTRNVQMEDGYEKMCREARKEYRHQRAVALDPEHFPAPIPYDKLSVKAKKMLRWSVDGYAAFFEAFSGLGAIPDHCLPWVNVFITQENEVLNVPRKHAKTTVMAEWLSIWLFARDRQNQILLLSKTAALAIRSARRIAHELEFNNDLNRTYGRFVSDPWRPESGELMVAGRERLAASGDFSLQVRGSEQQILGMEAKYVIADDITDRKVARSETSSAEELHRLRNEALGCLTGDDTRALIIGQRVHPRDMYARLLEEEEDDGDRAWIHQSYPAVLEGNLLKDPPEKIKLLWPQPRKGTKYPMRWLKTQRRRLGHEGFQTYFQQAPSLEGASGIREEWVPGCLDNDRPIGKPRAIRPQGVVTRVISVDPSPSRYAGFVVADVISAPGNTSFEIEVLDARRELDIGTDGLLRWLADFQLRYGASCCVLEMNSLRIILRDQAFSQIQNLFSHRVIQHSTTQVSKQHETLGLWSMQSLWEFGRLRLPYGDEAGKNASDLLIQEALGQVPTTDVLMALWFIHYNAITLRAYAPGALPTRFRTPQGPTHNAA